MYDCATQDNLRYINDCKILIAGEPVETSARNAIEL
jgi:hypothetical protein